MINRLNFRYLAVLLFLIDFVRCGCKNNNPSEDNDNTSNSDATTISSSSPLPTPPPITQDMIDAVKIAPGLQDLLRQLQAGGNVDLNKPIDSKTTDSLFTANDLPLNLVYIDLVRSETSADAGYTQALLKIIESLLSRGAKPNPTIDVTGTGDPTRAWAMPLVVAVIIAQRVDILESLLKYKDETFMKKHNGHTPYAYAKKFASPPEQAQFLQAFEAAGINS